MLNEINFGGSSNFILAEGKRGRLFGTWWLFAVVVLALLVSALIAFVILLSRPVPIPASEALFITASPKALAGISPALIKTLPNEVREIIQTDGHWPVTVGLYRSGERWHWFMVGPRWMIKNASASNGFVSIFLSEKQEHEETRNFFYTKSLAALFPFRETVSIEIEPQLLADASGLAISLDAASIKGRFEHGLLIFDVPFEADRQNPPLQTADVALTIPKNGITEDALKDFIRRLSNGRHHDLNIPELSQYHVWLDDYGHPTLSKYNFESDLTNQNAAELLGAYGFFSKKTVLLPDGTLSYEHITPSASSTDGVFGEHINEQREVITLTKNELSVQTAEHAPTAMNTVQECNHSPSMRLSGKSLGFLLDSIGAERVPDELPNIQIGSDNNKLSICFE